jgi:hypothetical protein
LRKPELPCYEDKKTGEARLCVRCQEDADAEERQLEEERTRAASEKKGKKITKGALRARLIKKAKTSEEGKTG